MHTLYICIIDDVDEEPISEQQEVITAKEAKYLFNRLWHKRSIECIAWSFVGMLTLSY